MLTEDGEEWLPNRVRRNLLQGDFEAEDWYFPEVHDQLIKEAVEDSMYLHLQAFSNNPFPAIYAMRNTACGKTTAI
jgi:hypothetical protein